MNKNYSYNKKINFNNKYNNKKYIINSFFQENEETIKRRDINEELTNIIYFLKNSLQTQRSTTLIDDRLNRLNTMLDNYTNLTVTLVIYKLINQKNTPDSCTPQQLFIISKFLFNYMINKFPTYNSNFVISRVKYNLGNYNLTPSNVNSCPLGTPLLEYILTHRPFFYQNINNRTIDIKIKENLSFRFSLPSLIKYPGIQTSGPAVDIGGITQIFYEEIQKELNKTGLIRGNLDYLKETYNNYPLKIKIINSANSEPIILNNFDELSTINNGTNLNKKKKNICQILHFINIIYLCSMSKINEMDVFDLSGRLIEKKIFKINISEDSEFYKFIMLRFYISQINRTNKIDFTDLPRNVLSNLFTYFLLNYNSFEGLTKLFSNSNKKLIFEGNRNLNYPSFVMSLLEYLKVPFLSNENIEIILRYYGYPSIGTFIKEHFISTNVSIENKDKIKEKITILSSSHINPLSPQKKNKIKAAFDRFIDLLNQKELDIFCSYITGTTKLSNYYIKIFDIDPNVVQTNSSGRPIFTRPFASHTCFNTLDLNINISTAANNNALEELVFNYLTRPKSGNNGNSEIRYQLIYAFSRSENLGIA